MISMAMRTGWNRPSEARTSRWTHPFVHVAVRPSLSSFWRLHIGQPHPAAAFVSVASIQQKIPHSPEGEQTIDHIFNILAAPPSAVRMRIVLPYCPLLDHPNALELFSIRFVRCAMSGMLVAEKPGLAEQDFLKRVRYVGRQCCQVRIISVLRKSGVVADNTVF